MIFKQSNLSIHILGRMQSTIHVTLDNNILAELPREDALKAHCIQFSALYNLEEVLG